MSEPVRDSYLIIGTAGHVDHGKTTLIRALTGRETDRLPEERRRGISIELGFAPFVLPSGRRAGVVDVPGHERFVRHMVSGAFGMDLVLLVVAADEGVMPQTEEHVAILSLLGLEAGLIVLTKADLVDEAVLKRRRDELKTQLAGTFLAGAEILPFAASTGAGLAEIKSAIDQLSLARPARSDQGPARLPVDRAFVMSGFGTVVTGTLLSGRLSLDDRLVAVPAERPVRVRQIQVHGEARTVARAGERVALNLAQVETAEVGRGSLILGKGGGERTDTVYVRLTLVSGAPSMRSNQRLHIHALTSEVIGQVVLLEGDRLEPGQSALARVRLERPLWLLPGDRLVLRQVAPQATVGGGVVIATKGRYRRRRAEDLADLGEMETGGLAGRLRAEARHQMEPASAGAAPAELLRELAADQTLRRLGGQWLSAHLLAVRQRALVSYLEQLRRDQPERLGERPETVRQRFFPELEGPAFTQLMSELAGSSGLRQGRELIGLATGPDEAHPLAEPAQRLLALLESTPFAPPSAGQLAEALALPLGELERLGRYLVESAQAVRIGEWWFTRSALDEAERRIRKWFEAHPQMTAGEFRDLIATSRRYAIPLLEYFDSRRVTRRVGEVRILVP